MFLIIVAIIAVRIFVAYIAASLTLNILLRHCITTMAERRTMSRKRSFDVAFKLEVVVAAESIYCQQGSCKRR